MKKNRINKIVVNFIPNEERFEKAIEIYANAAVKILNEEKEGKKENMA